MSNFSFSVDSDLPPEQIIAVATDFTERRPDHWHNISRRYYIVHEMGDRWAVVTEGSDMAGGTWARERYEWTKTYVRGTVQESNIFRPGGTWELRVVAREGGGSHVESVYRRPPRGLKGHLMSWMMQLLGPRMLRPALIRTLESARS
jgi:hypothetical protein